MIEEDTIRLLQECDAGIKMGVQSISEVLPHVSELRLKKMLEECRNRHDRLGKEVEKELDHLHEEGKDPGLMAQAMSWMKTNGKLSLEMSDRTIAGLMTDGANMGVKTLHRYLNQYQNAGKDARDIALRLVSMEEQLVKELQPYL